MLPEVAFGVYLVYKSQNILEGLLHSVSSAVEFSTVAHLCGPYAYSYYHTIKSLVFTGVVSDFELNLILKKVQVAGVLGLTCIYVAEIFLEVFH